MLQLQGILHMCAHLWSWINFFGNLNFVFDQYLCLMKKDYLSMRLKRIFAIYMLIFLIHTID